MSHFETHRLHAFDNVRGLAAVAVVALHASYAYARFPLAGLVWPVPLDEPSSIADAVFWAIEGSVMPLFFTLSGYFLVRSLSRQEPGRVLAARTRRLLLPMTTVGLAVLAVDLHVWVLGLITSDRATVREYRRLKFAPEIQTDLFGPAHLWYIEYLWLLCAGFCAATWLWRRMSAPSNMLDRRSILACGIFALTASLCGVLTSSPQVVVGFQHSWLPDPAKLAHSGLFLLFGALLNAAPRLTWLIRRTALALVVTAGVSFAVLLPKLHNLLPLQAGNAAIGTGFMMTVFAITATFAVIGVGLRWLDRPVPMLTRLAAASFWIYLVHHPIVGLSHIALRGVAMPSILKGLVTLLVTLTLCLWSFDRFASRGVVARLLDGEWPWKAWAPVKRVEPQHAIPERRRAA